jgi:nucleotide-binding universal stress UspA family protein
LQWGHIRSGGSLPDALLHELRAARYDLLVMAVSVRPGDKLFLGDLAAQMLQQAQCSLLFVCGDTTSATQRPR